LVVTKKEIIRTISEDADIQLTQLKTKAVVQKTFDTIIETLVEDTLEKLRTASDGTLGRIELRNFGVFEVKRRAARKARNPRTGAKVDVPEKFVVTFKPGKEMEERVRRLEEAAARQKKQAATTVPMRGIHPAGVPPTEGFAAPTYESNSESAN
jgi:nucleoid DNA-binding protein